MTKIVVILKQKKSKSSLGDLLFFSEVFAKAKVKLS